MRELSDLGGYNFVYIRNLGGRNEQESAEMVGNILVYIRNLRAEMC